MKNGYDRSIKRDKEERIPGDFIYLKQEGGKKEKLYGNALGSFNVLKRIGRNLEIKREGMIEMVNIDRVARETTTNTGENATNTHRNGAGNLEKGTPADMRPKHSDERRWLVKEMFEHRVRTDGGV